MSEMKPETTLTFRAVTEVTFQAQVSIEERNDRWAARISPFGIVVYADSGEALDERIDDAMSFLVSQVGNLRNYLESHNVTHVLGEPRVEHEDDNPVIPAGKSSP